MGYSMADNLLSSLILVTCRNSIFIFPYLFSKFDHGLHKTIMLHLNRQYDKCAEVVEFLCKLTDYLYVLM